MPMNSVKTTIMVNDNVNFNNISVKRSTIACCHLLKKKKPTRLNTEMRLHPEWDFWPSSERYTQYM